ncbi:hypothetical protein [Leptospira kirschneri]|uniref:Uncharacterized protein n=2 Tax=Leptospira kirschneri TaxID=29507 RepID=A0A0E2BF87_9LEPT|nr:hypothetical protein [Leptospira kirschneri]EKO15864.1 hypothetical protein LEP1GSC081_3310 [Leptospira kirschneri str. H1]EMK24932.1 hypothetical protein LEP1GSC008_3095 [Leptospira kirschneri serovar Bulgarica str. Nikolaevo]
MKAFRLLKRALGAGSDNVFLKRAQEKTNVEDWLQEADQGDYNRYFKQE